MNPDSGKPVLCLFFRKPVSNFFSIEKVFDSLREGFDRRFHTNTVVLPLHSSSPGNILRNLLFARRQKADIYHISGDVHYLALGLPRDRTVLTIHDCVFIYQSRGIKRLILKWLFLDLPVRRSRYITTISEATRQDILKYTGCAPGKVVVISNPANGHISYQPREFRDRRPVVLFLGRTPNKNLDRVIPALEGLGCVLNIVGVPTESQENSLRQAGIEYEQRSGLSEQELVDQYVGADLVLFPSTFEGFGLPIIEAQKAGRPVITSNISPMKEVAGKGACLVDPFKVETIREGVLSVIRDKKYREQLVSEGFRNVERFTPAAIVGQYSDVYEKILSV